MSIDVRREAATAAPSREVSQTWELDLDYVTVARFASLVAERAAPHLSTRDWATERMTLDGLFPYALLTYRDRTERAALVELTEIVGDWCIANVSLEFEHARVRMAADRAEALAEAEEWFRELYPETKPDAAQRVSIAFWASSTHVHRVSRALDVPAWSEVRCNYPSRSPQRSTRCSRRRSVRARAVSSCSGTAHPGRARPLPCARSRGSGGAGAVSTT